MFDLAQPGAGMAACRNMPDVHDGTVGPASTPPGPHSSPRDAGERGRGPKSISAEEDLPRQDPAFLSGLDVFVQRRSQRTFPAEAHNSLTCFVERLFSEALQ